MKQTNIERISVLVDFLWPSSKFTAQVYVMPQNAVRVMIVKAKEPDPSYLATVDIEPKHQGPGYVVRASYPAFNGTVGQMEDYAEVIGLLPRFMTKLNEAAVIKGA